MDQSDNIIELEQGSMDVVNVSIVLEKAEL